MKECRVGAREDHAVQWLPIKRSKNVACITGRAAIEWLEYLPLVDTTVLGLGVKEIYHQIQTELLAAGEGAPVEGWSTDACG